MVASAASSSSYPAETGSRSSSKPSMFMTMVPREIVQGRILMFLTNDGQAIGRFSICCKSHYYDLLQSPPLPQKQKQKQQQQQQQEQKRRGSEDRCDLIWKEMIYHRWKNTKREYHTTIGAALAAVGGDEDVAEEEKNSNNNNSNTFSTSRQLYFHRRSVDRFVVSTVDEMAKMILPHILQYHQQQMSSDGTGGTSTVVESSMQSIISSVYTNEIVPTENYESLLQHRGDSIDTLLRIVNESLKCLNSTYQDGSGAATASAIKEIGRNDHKESPPSPSSEPSPNRGREQNEKSNIDDSLFRRVRGFLAARLVVRFHFAECLVEWECQRSNFNIIFPQDIDTGTTAHPTSVAQQQQQDSSLRSAEYMERFVLLMNLTEQTLDDLLNRHGQSCRGGSTMDTSDVTKVLDEIATSCRERIDRLSIDDEKKQDKVSTAEKIQIVNDVITQDYGFGGNEQNYYVYRNSILSHVLRTRKGIPLTLSIVYVCVCRRLGLPVDVIGLPGHVVLGFQHDAQSNDDEDNDHDGLRPTNRSSTTTRAASPPRRGFLDVFHGGRVLSAADCQLICNSYGIPWQDSFLEPLKVPRIIERVVNNILHCHVRSTRTPMRRRIRRDDPPQPRDDLALYCRSLMVIQELPPAYTRPAIEQTIKHLPFVQDAALLAKFGIP